MKLHVVTMRPSIVLGFNRAPAEGAIIESPNVGLKVE